MGFISRMIVEPSLPPSKRMQSHHPSFPNRVHRRVVVQDYRKPIYKASSRVSLFAALEGCINGYASLHRAGILQSDISPNNLMVNEDADCPSWKAFIIDLDLAIKEDEKALREREARPAHEPLWRSEFSWNFMDTEELANMKIGVISEDDKFLKTTTEYLTEDYQLLIPHVNKLRSMREILREAQKDPEVIALN
ncbi:hypothetical protein ACJ73_08168 [Blastomyces percursus]|uniref:Fungal-type protein kinase domain-containing protein n=1 Tax=Blastomyces percursus TaxID=1658174 RepID=A0A1J9QYW6_9EURO|nr:hypothetical protein ACJ73_08168 [Blastomyces percursus]